MPYNTNNPTGTSGSADPRDLYDNAANFDLMSTSQTLTVVPDRLGQPRTTLHGYEVKANAVIDSMGMYRLADQTFGGGTTITSNKQLLLWATEDGGTGFHYYWTAEIPPGGKVVLPISTPDSTGGEGPGGWLAWDDLEQRLATGSALIGGELSKDISASLNKADIRLYAGVGIGLAAMIQLALNTVGAAYIPYGVWEHDGGTVAVADGQHIIFGGCIINKTFEGDSDFIQAYGKKQWSAKGAAVYFGTRGANPAVADENFIKVDGGRAYQCEGLIAYQCRGKGFVFRDGPSAGGVRGERGQINNCAAYECDTNLETGASSSAEYLVFTNFNSAGGRVGIKDQAGNTVFSGGNCTDNTETNFWLVGNYSNHAHGSVTAMNINHGGTYNIRVDNVTQGHTFSNCHIFGNSFGSSSGSIFLNNSKNILIEGGMIDCWIYNFEGADSGLNYIKNVIMPGGYGNVVRRDQDGLQPKELVVLGCHGEGAYESGVSINDPSEFYFLGIRNAGVTQSVVSGSLATVTYPNVQANGDRRRAYDSSTGLLEITIDQYGQYRIIITQHFQCASGADPANTYIELRINGTNKRLGTATLNGGIILTCQINTDVYLSGGDVLEVKCVVTGVSPVIGVSSYASTFSVERIG